MQKEEGLGLAPVESEAAELPVSRSTGVSDLESGFSGRLEETQGEEGGPHACTVLVAPVANAFPSTHTHAGTHTHPCTCAHTHTPRNSITCQARKRKLLSQSPTLFKSVSSIFQLGHRENAAGSKVSEAVSSAVIHETMSKGIGSIKTYSPKASGEWSIHTVYNTFILYSISSPTKQSMHWPFKRKSAWILKIIWQIFIKRGGFVFDVQQKFVLLYQDHPRRFCVLTQINRSSALHLFAQKPRCTSLNYKGVWYLDQLVMVNLVFMWAKADLRMAV